MRSSTSIKPSMIQRRWHLIDAHGETLGRLSCRIATLLMGKHKPYFVYHQDTGDYVIVVNAAFVHTTGKKLDQKMYYRHSGTPGGLKVCTLRDLLKKDPVRVVEHAVRGMLPKNKIGKKMYAKLHVFSGSAHPFGDKVAIFTKD